MKTFKFSYILTAIIFFSSCGIDQMATKYDTVNFTTTPPVLQAHGGKVSLNLDANFPAKYFAKKATVDFTPVLVYNEGETAFKTIIIQGEEATGVPTGQKQKILKSNEQILNRLGSGEALSKEETDKLFQEWINNAEQLGLSPEEATEELEAIFNPDSEFNQYQLANVQLDGIQDPPKGITYTSPEGKKELARFTSEVRQAYLQSDSVDDQRIVLIKLGTVLEQSGMPDDLIAEVIDKIFSAKGGTSTEGEVVTAQSTGAKDEGNTEDVKGENMRLFEMYKKNEITLEEIRKKSPLLARTISKGKGLAPIHKIEDWVKKLANPDISGPKRPNKIRK